MRHGAPRGSFGRSATWCIRTTRISATRAPLPGAVVPGARGLRAIMENIMLDVMYDIPSQPNIKEVLISEEVVTNREHPIVLYQKAAETA